MMWNRRVSAVSIAGIAAATLMSAGIHGQSGRLTAGDMSYLGSFKVPMGTGNGLAYGGTGLAFNPVNGSLFIVGHDWDQLTAEISIPSFGATATLLQPLTDSTSGKLAQIGTDANKIGGNLVFNGNLYTSAFNYYDATGSQTRSHFVRSSTSLSAPAAGPVRVGLMGAGYYSGYMAETPAEWQASLGGPALTGNCCLSIISRTSYGPAVSAFNPEAMGTAYPLVYYDQAHQALGLYGASGSHPLFNGATKIRGLVFPRGTSSVLFIGTTGIGNYCYGEAAACGDPTNNSKGEHAYPYRGYVWAYDAADLAAVKAGSKQPWAVFPYATWELPNIGDVGFDQVGGAAYDPATGRIFISKKNADSDKPVIHVFRVNGETPTLSPPQPPTNVRVTP